MLTFFDSSRLLPIIMQSYESKNSFIYMYIYIFLAVCNNIQVGYTVGDNCLTNCFFFLRTDLLTINLDRDFSVRIVLRDLMYVCLISPVMREKLPGIQKLVYTCCKIFQRWIGIYIDACNMQEFILKVQKYFKQF